MRLILTERRYDCETVKMGLIKDKTIKVGGGSAYLLAASRVAHEQWSDKRIGSDVYGFLPELRVLEQSILVTFNPTLKNPEKNVQAVIVKRWLNHVQQRFILD